MRKVNHQAFPYVLVLLSETYLLCCFIATNIHVLTLLQTHTQQM